MHQRAGAERLPEGKVARQRLQLSQRENGGGRHEHSLSIARPVLHVRKPADSAGRRGAPRLETGNFLAART